MTPVAIVGNGFSSHIAVSELDHRLEAWRLDPESSSSQGIHSSFPDTHTLTAWRSGLTSPETTPASFVEQTYRTLSALQGEVPSPSPAKAKVHKPIRITEIAPTTGGWQLWSDSDAPVLAQRVFLAPGGAPHRAHRWLEDLGHTVTRPYPAFAGLKCTDRRFSRLTCSLAAVQVRLEGAENDFIDPPASLDVTPNGLTGPVMARLVHRHLEELKSRDWQGRLVLRLSSESTHAWRSKLAERTQAHRRRNVAEDPPGNFPSKLWPRLVKAAKISPETRWSQLSSRQTQTLLGQLTHATVAFSGRLPYRAESVWRGGVALHEIDPTSMESRLAPGIHVLGGLLDVDGPPGGVTASWHAVTGRVAALATLQLQSPK